ncbi:MAG: type II secretion system F family protein [Elusimicrobia bacterium]|nr:type II secretion system F family protein [Elusimicrobiota bacterium]
MSEGILKWVMLAVGILGSMAAYTAVSRLLTPPPPPSETDLSQLAKREVGMTSAFSRLNPHGSIWDRLDLFLLRALRLEAKLEELHMLMGRPEKPSPLDMLHMKEVLAAVMGGGFAWLTGSPVLLIFGVVGFFIPDSIFNGRIRTRQTEIMRSFPTFVDLAALTIEAGLDYMTAFDRIVKISKDKSELEGEVGKMLGEVQLGYSRRDALKRFSMRTGIQEIRSFVGLITQSDELGTSLVDLLRNYAADMRFRRLNKAEKLAAQAATKMLIPLMVFIFPTVFIMMLGPMLKNLMAGGFGF